MDIFYEESGEGTKQKIIVLRANVDDTQKTLKVRRRDIGAGVETEFGANARDEGLRIKLSDGDRLWPVLMREMTKHYGLATIDRILELCLLAGVEPNHWSSLEREKR